MFVADENGRIVGWVHVHDDWALETGHTALGCTRVKQQQVFEKRL